MLTLRRKNVNSVKSWVQFCGQFNPKIIVILSVSRSLSAQCVWCLYVLKSYVRYLHFFYRNCPSCLNKIKKEERIIMSLPGSEKHVGTRLLFWF